ncbi:2-succinyl-5-enolpyruvyl-6-hydroxy-3-cyclohexene-1-carboxylic-acid synthase [Actinotalea sp.]|uniref:2-succinyl-5-enolpyruvyl-6-hydroxy-3- cyclohexene-1-carboxylic-acid synthase n=1 Tax=Actinotalea sp. TaxID=1872145 RepID=UPI0035674D53
MNPSTRAARVLVGALTELGLRHVVLAPGSRSAPLAYAVAQADLPADHPDRDPNAPELELHVRIDERSAAFLALGLARAAVLAGDPRPVAVVTTSGTAVAHLLPAVLEAAHSGLPLLLLTADRPHELRGTGANQTTDQVGLLAPAVRATLDVPAPSGRPGEDQDLRNLAVRAVATALGTRTGDPGPVHLNLAYREPLVPDADAWPVPVGRGRSAVAALAADVPADLPTDGPTDLPDDAPTDPVRTVVVAGDGAGPAAVALARRHGWPLLAEPSSGARGGADAVPAYRLLLDLPELGGAVRRVIVLGRPTLSRPVQSLLSRADVEVVVVAPRGGSWPDPARSAAVVVPELPADLAAAGRGDPGWARTWRRAGAAALAAIAAVLEESTSRGEPLPGPALAAALAEHLGARDVLVVGASNPVRDLDLVAAWAQPPTVVANRGLAGIDGTISTAAGVALGLGRPVRAYLGDVTFLHEIGGLLLGPDEPTPDLQIVVANDSGGSIFATLEHGEGAHSALAGRVLATPHRADLGALCAGYGVAHRRVRDLQGLHAALAEPVRGLGVVEVVVDRADRRALGARLAERVRSAVSDALGTAAGTPVP